MARPTNGKRSFVRTASAIREHHHPRGIISERGSLEKAEFHEKKGTRKKENGDEKKVYKESGEPLRHRRGQRLHDMTTVYQDTATTLHRSARPVRRLNPPPPAKVWGAKPVLSCSAIGVAAPKWWSPKRHRYIVKPLTDGVCYRRRVWLLLKPEGLFSRFPPTLQDFPSSLVGKLTYLSASMERTMALM